MDNSKINVRNVYIELLNKMKAIEGVDIEYIDKLVQLLYDDINLIDIDVKNIQDLIPEDASTENQLVTTSDLPAAQVNSDWNATSGVAEILNKPTIPAAQVNSDWNATSGVAQILNKPNVAIAAYTEFTLEVIDWTYDQINNRWHNDNSQIGAVSSWRYDILPLVGSMDNESDYSLLYDIHMYLSSGSLIFDFYATEKPTHDIRVGVWYYY